MKMMFVWDKVSGLTDRYHDGGSVVVIADDIDSARGIMKKEGVRGDSEVWTDKPDFSAHIEAEEDRVFIFPDAGCC